MVQGACRRFFPFQNIRIFENRFTKNIFASIWKIFLIFFRSKNWKKLDFNWNFSKIEKSKKVGFQLKFSQNFRSQKFRSQKFQKYFSNRHKIFFFSIDFQKSGCFEKEKLSPVILHHKLACFIDGNQQKPSLGDACHNWTNLCHNWEIACHNCEIMLPGIYIKKMRNYIVLFF